MAPFVQRALDLLAPADFWPATCLILATGSFVTYVGLTLCVTLFHPDEGMRRHAADILDQLLSVINRKNPNS